MFFKGINDEKENNGGCERFGGDSPFGAGNLPADEQAAPSPALPDQVASDLTTEGPIGTIHRTRYIRTDRAYSAAVLTHFYRGTGLVREEYLTLQPSSDIYITPRRRVSEDNGKTWSSWEVLPE